MITAMNSIVRLSVLLLILLVLGANWTSGQAQTPEYSYANTPEELQPYQEFYEQYKMFFQDPQPFLGAGRETPPPADLVSVKIGLMAPLEDSPDVRIGRQLLRGAQMAVEDANAEGGYEGLPYQLVVRNDAGPWGTSSNKFVELVDRGVWGVLGSIDGAGTHIAIRIAFKAHVPFVISGPTDPTLTETRLPWSIRVNADDRQLGYALALQIFQENDFQHVAVLRENDRYGRMGIAEFEESARLLGHPILLERRYVEGDTSFTSQLQYIEQSQAEAVVLWGDADEAGHIVRQMEEMGMDLPIFGSSRLVSDHFLEIAGPAANGVVAAATHNPNRSDSLLHDFERSFEARYGRTPGPFAAHAYDGTQMIVLAVREVGLNRARIRDWLTGRDHYSGVTGRIVFDTTWNDVGPVWLARVRNQTFEFTSAPLNR